MARKSSKENNTSAGPVIVGTSTGGSSSNKNNFINNLVYPGDGNATDGSEVNLISSNINNGGATG
jgi:hypothetical protein